ncbi:hypothetical protein L3Y34_011807 [Caenorhabditis briggsae]|uniref:Uncharacterized protein n=1 Tax=Caenorhabditis briggsae TaxID=6238 RepID=A0AAE8ZVB9_CAEBR|nr:hypothetical protein L3Y34_011807 [Caenorhabditis briggsae]
MFVVVDNTIPTWTVLVLVILALFWGVIVALALEVKTGSQNYETINYSIGLKLHNDSPEESQNHENQNSPVMSQETSAIYSLYIADVSWVACFAKQAVDAKRQSEEQHRYAATSRQSVFVVGDQERNLEASRRLIREV